MKRKWEPAFPYESMRANWSGMSLRDYFAAAALQGLCANPNYLKWMEGNPDPEFDALLAKDAYSSADAMLAEREKE